MLNQPTPVSSRTRSRTESQLREKCYERKKGKVEVVELEEAEPKAKMNATMAEFSSKKETDQVEILVEETDIGLQGCKQAEKDPDDVIFLGPFDDTEDDDDDEDDDEDDSTDEALTSTSGEDNDESEDLDYYYEEEEDPQCSVSSQSDEEAEDNKVEALFPETPSHAKGKTVEVDLASENDGDGRKKSNRSYICVDEVDEDDSADDEDDSVDDEDVTELTPAKTKSRKKGRPPSKKLELLRVLTDTILDEEDSDSSKTEEVPEEEAPEEEAPTEEFLPLKFTFGSRDKITPEKTEFEKEMDSMWAEMQFCLMSSEIGLTEPSSVEKGDADVSEVKHDRATLCRQGNHQLVLDEEIGMICKFCSFVQLEIRYIAPPFVTPSNGKYDGQYYGTMESGMLDGLYQDLANDRPACAPSADIEGTVWEIIPDLKKKLYPHQCEAFEFIWTNIAGGIYRDKSKNPSEGGDGCIISHAPGTGKTLLTIVFLQTYLKEYPGCRPVIVAPRSMLLTWEAEFKKWKVDIPFHNLNSPDFSGKEKTKGVDLYKMFERRVPYSDRALARRLVKLLSWKSDGGILGISYRLFEQLAGKDNKGKQKCTGVDQHVSKILLDLPGLFVFDEGHTPRNDDTLMWKALSGIKTERRIILSGTPFQNNFEELFNTLCLVRPRFDEEIQCGHRERVNKRHGSKGNEAKRKWTSLTGSIGKDVDKDEAKKLRKIRDVLKPFVHVHKGTILQSTVPGLRHSVVVLQPSDLQKKILDGVKEIKNMMFLDYYVSLISIHPSLVLQLSDHNGLKESLGSIISIDELKRIRLKPDKGVKTKFLMELLKLSGALEEKVIVFGQYLEPLSLIIEQLKDFFKWKEGKEIVYMDGKCDIKQRQSVINVFNDPTSEARVLLASTKACSEGIHLVGGSRVVLLDVTWNPSVERQAVSRAYRLGQKKVVYTYHLISSGTLERVKCSRQAGKDRLSELLFSSDKGDDHLKKVCNVQEDKVLEEMLQHEKLKSMFDNIINQPKDSDLILTYGEL